MSTFHFDLYAAVGSDLTSSTYFVGDSEELTLQLIIGSASSLTVQGSNVTGLSGPAVGEDDWSNLTQASITADDMLNIEPGFRLIRCTRTSGITNAIVAGRNRVL